MEPKTSGMIWVVHEHTAEDMSSLITAKDIKNDEIWVVIQQVRNWGEVIPTLSFDSYASVFADRDMAYKFAKALVDQYICEHYDESPDRTAHIEDAEHSLEYTARFEDRLDGYVLTIEHQMIVRTFKQKGFIL